MNVFLIGSRYNGMTSVGRMIGEKPHQAFLVADSKREILIKYIDA
jgi:hypothetical protein